MLAAPIADFGARLSVSGRSFRASAGAGAEAADANHGSKGKQKGVGPPDAVNTGGPVPLIEILARKGGFAGRVKAALSTVACSPHGATQSVP
ncbi:hypothetical protein EDE08_120124 [Bradyrhizobium sp. R2.2-H]|nr:hypothetical protein EDE10_12015 [Bradyrhizobium sp. Y-H1]TCU64982.1 hypothetical protein EDE08_120124 [Bradyrhizobium sp. R2.2-H]